MRLVKNILINILKLVKKILIDILIAISISVLYHLFWLLPAYVEVIGDIFHIFCSNEIIFFSPIFIISIITSFKRNGLTKFLFIDSFLIFFLAIIFIFINMILWMD